MTIKADAAAKLLQFLGSEDWEIDYSAPATGLIIRHQSGTEITIKPDGTVDAPSTTVDALEASTTKTTGYSWSDQSGSRSFDTWFTAPSDRDIFFTVEAQASADGTQVSLSIDINTSQTINTISAQSLTIDSASSIALGSFKVPAGQHYQVRAFGATSNYSIDTWGELR